VVRITERRVEAERLAVGDDRGGRQLCLVALGFLELLPRLALLAHLKRLGGGVGAAWNQERRRLGFRRQAIGHGAQIGGTSVRDRGPRQARTQRGCAPSRQK